MSINVVWNANSPLEADTLAPLGFVEVLLTLGTISQNTATSFTLSLSTPEGDLIGDITGSNFTYATVDGNLVATGGLLDAMELKAVIPLLGNIDFIDYTNIDIDIASIAAAVQADITGTDDTAVEDVLLGLDWNMTLNNTDADAGTGWYFGDGNVELNLQGDDVIRGLGGKDILYSGDGNDKVFGGKGSDTLIGGKGKDKLKGENGNDTLEGGKGNDKLFGGKGNDTMNGGNGKDKLYNGLGSDEFSGGNGNDTFIFGKTSELVSTGDDNVITDFTVGSDTIDLSGIDANSSESGSQSFVFIGGDDFNESARDLRVEEVGTNEYSIQGDVDGDGIADFDILVQSSVALTSDDFIL